MTTINLRDGVNTTQIQSESRQTMYSEADIIESIQRVASKLEKNPTRDEYIDHTTADEPCASTISNRLGWVDAKEKAGVGGNVSTVDVNEQYFNSIDSHEKAYWFGLIVSDGSVVESGNYGCLSTVLELQSTDRDTIEHFKRSIDSGHKISTINGSHENASPHARIAVSNTEFTENLIELGVSKNKSQTDDFPSIKRSYRPAFIRGYSDGDGSVNIYKHHGEKTGEWKLFNKSKSRLETMFNWIKNCGVSSGNINCQEGVHRLSISKESDLRRVWRTMYPKGNQTNPSMTRKVHKFEELMEVIEQ